METLDLLSFEECNKLEPGDHVRRLMLEYKPNTANFTFVESEEEYVVLSTSVDGVHVKTLDGSKKTFLHRGEIVSAYRNSDLITSEEVEELLLGIS